MDRIKDLIDFVLDLIIPRDTEVTKIENMSETEILNNIPLANETKNSKYRALFQYKNKLSRKAIWAIKYNKNQKIVSKFSNLLYEFILENITDDMVFSNFYNPIFIPIPMHTKNLKERGYNQSEMIVKEILKIDKNFNGSFNALTKIKETPHQSTLKNKSERLRNLKGCFFADTEKVKNRNIILIDDVITTGTTMEEAAKTLREAGAKKIIGFSLAH